MIFSVKKFSVRSKIFGHFDLLLSLIGGHHWIENSRKWGGVLEVSRPCDRFPSKFQNFERDCSITALDDVKCGYTAVPLKILKLAWEPIAGPWDLQNPPHFRLFSIQWWPQIIDMSESKWPNIFDMTNNFWPKKCFFFLIFWLALGLPEYFPGNFYEKIDIFYEMESGIRESRVRRRFRNHEWDDGNPGTTSETTETRPPRGNGFSVLRIF